MKIKEGLIAHGEDLARPGILICQGPALCQVFLIVAASVTMTMTLFNFRVEDTDTQNLDSDTQRDCDFLNQQVT